MSQEKKQIRLLGFVKISGEIEAVTGLHIGGTSDAIDKGGIDSPVIKNPVTNEPYIPGSSLRGRIRSILEKVTGAPLSPMTVKEDIWMEFYKDKDETDKKNQDAFKKALESKVCRIFGNSSSEPGVPSVLIVRDAMLSNKDKYMMNDLLPITEAKIETVIDRITGHAMPRTIERVPAGARFGLEIIYRVETYENGKFVDDADTDKNLKEEERLQTKCNRKLREDLENIVLTLEIIQNHTGLGGNTSRGHGQVRFDFSSLEVKTIQNNAEVKIIQNNEAKDFTPPSEHSFDGYKNFVKTLSFSLKPDNASD